MQRPRLRAPTPPAWLPPPPGASRPPRAPGSVAPRTQGPEATRLQATRAYGRTDMGPRWVPHPARRPKCVPNTAGAGGTHGAIFCAAVRHPSEGPLVPQMPAMFAASPVPLLGCHARRGAAARAKHACRALLPTNRPSARRACRLVTRCSAGGVGGEPLAQTPSATLVQRVKSFFGSLPSLSFLSAARADSLSQQAARSWTAPNWQLLVLQRCCLTGSSAISTP